MKWVALISCLVLVSFAESNHLPRRYRDVGHDTIKSVFEHFSSDFGSIVYALYSQILQKATLQDVTKLRDNIVALAEKCAADEQSDLACVKPLHTIFLDNLCHEQGVTERHKVTECCAKADPERNECIISHKNATPGFIPPFDPPSLEDCKDYHSNASPVLDVYNFEISRRHPFTNIASILKAKNEYDEVLETCCQAADKNVCFGEKVPDISQQLQTTLAVQINRCGVLKTYGEPTVKALKIIKLAPKFLKADLATASKIGTDAAHTYAECCRGDTLQCFLDGQKLIAYICSHQDTISSQMKSCCEKPLLERVMCLLSVENEDKPEDLTPTLKEFVEGKDMCQNFSTNMDQHLLNFVFQYAKGHPEFSAQLLLRLTKQYHDLMEECCAIEIPEPCLSKKEEQLEKLIADSKAVVTAACTRHSKLGNYAFQNMLLTRYTKKAPQLEFADLHEYTKQLTSIADKCCNQDDGYRLKCSEGNVDIVLGAICQQHAVYYINRQISRCCSGSYPFRRECFSGLGTDPDYFPVPFNPELFTFHEDLCLANPEEQQTMKQMFLVFLVKHKLSITDEQLLNVNVKFTGMVAKCCDANNHEECFSVEGPKLVAEIRTALGDN
ncbi:albumin-like isoform X2 [Varanus komodoensis]|uniref:albumin-like isoform X2 n=1 Tax=Varanus komodoensis TaxID=61221 RepID=UPI001CF795F0|nr:albumin-like isoform X2 [Varanus komodoensis]